MISLSSAKAVGHARDLPVVGQLVKLRRIANPPVGVMRAAGRRIANPPQVRNLPHIK